MPTADAAAADALVARRVRDASSSFYWAMRLMPPRRRRAMFALYAFCREVDDIADDPLTTAESKCAALEAWRARVGALYGDAEAVTEPGPICTALRPAIADFGLERADFLAVIDGMEMDAAGPVVAPDLATLDLYCDRVAAAVGRLSVRIFGEAG
ncbi:MAG TPA: squalene synthase HpnD, partial [Rhodospirillales bacterium]|nr:squalene synthase HpnD [Rhodospirillales bacterium]